MTKLFKECPYCREEILAKAIKCKYCHSMLELTPDSSAEAETQEIVLPPPLPGDAQPTVSTPPPLNVAGATQQRASISPPPLPRNAQPAVVSPPPPPLPGRGTLPPPPPPPGRSAHYPGQASAGDPFPQTPGSAPLELDVRAGSPVAAYNYPKAELGKRVIAYIIDMFVACIGLIITAPVAFIPMYRYISSGGWISPSGLQWVMIVLGLIVGFGWAAFYSLLRDGFGKGQSIGKKAVGLMVVRLKDNLPCTKRDSLVRNVVAIGISVVLCWMPVINFFAGFAEPIIAIIHQKGMRLGDTLAKTQVIDAGRYQQ